VVQSDPDRLLAQYRRLGSNDLWAEFLGLCGCALRGKCVADFNDSGLMLQAVESDLGIALARELLAADALQTGRLVRVSPLSLPHREGTGSYGLLNPVDLSDWPPLQALRQWLADEMELSRQGLAQVMPKCERSRPRARRVSGSRA
jgi:LysR family transcriptional regulator, glycine cleavage system transcriptional activator